MSQPIPAATATTMIQTYVNYMESLGVDMGRQTISVSFDGTAVMQWLTTVMPFADELRICIGVYVPGEPNAGRITAILWPYKNGKPANDGADTTVGNRSTGGRLIDPFNVGDNNP